MSSYRGLHPIDVHASHAISFEAAIHHPVQILDQESGLLNGVTKGKGCISLAGNSFRSACAVFNSRAQVFSI